MSAAQRGVAALLGTAPFPFRPAGAAQPPHCHCDCPTEWRHASVLSRPSLPLCAVCAAVLTSEGECDMVGEGRMEL